MDVGWHLRLSRENSFTVLVAPNLIEAVKEQLHIYPGWTMETSYEEGYARAILTRIPPSAKNSEQH